MGNKRSTNDNRSGPLYVHAEIDSHVPRTEPGDWALEIRGSIRVSEGAHRALIEVSDAEIGFIKAFLIQTREARQKGWNPPVVLKAKSFATSEYTELFKNGKWRKRVSKKFEPHSADLLILDRIELKPEYRGRGFGLLATRCVIEMFGSRCGLVACKPHPLQFEGTNRWQPPSPRKTLRKAQKKLRRYWARVGFQRVPRTVLYALDPERSLPRVMEMLRTKGK